MSQVDFNQVELNNFSPSVDSQSSGVDLSADGEVLEATGGGSNAGVIDGKSSKAGAIFNFVNSIIGAGIIGIPFAIRDCGLIMGVLLLIFTAAQIFERNHFEIFFIIVVNDLKCNSSGMMICCYTTACISYTP